MNYRMYVSDGHCYQVCIFYHTHVFVVVFRLDVTIFGQKDRTEEFLASTSTSQLANLSTPSVIHFNIKWEAKNKQ